MSTHRRELILQNIETTLDGISSLEDVQRLARSNPLKDLPCAIIYAGPESKDPVPYPQSTCSFSVFIDLWARQDESDTTNFDTILNALLLDIEKALASTYQRGGYAENTDIVSIIPFETVEGKNHFGLIIELKITYKHKQTDPSLAS